MLRTTGLSLAFCSVLLIGCAHETQIVKIQKVPLEIPSELLNCGFPPAIPAKPKTGDDGITSSQMVEILWATAFDCNQKLQAIREINGK